ncbi:MAG: cytochrome c [Rhodoferax sp.]|nr:cytochrome c [Rhodoferax sp.]
MQRHRPLARLAPLTLALAAAGVTVTGWGQRIKDLPPSALGVNVPALSPQAQAGQRIFDAECATCHGRFGTGTDKGPPLLNAIYNAGHHADEAFFRAAQQGVRQHHWQFGDMPAQPQVSAEQLAQIVRYVRELQQANGIRFEPHRM